MRNQMFDCKAPSSPHLKTSALPKKKTNRKGRHVLTHWLLFNAFRGICKATETACDGTGCMIDLYDNIRTGIRNYQHLPAHGFSYTAFPARLPKTGNIGGKLAARGILRIGTSSEKRS